MPTVRIGHSPDADDAFMFYALTAGKVKIPGVTIEHVLEDIESLNRRARTAELEVTAVSFASYLLIADQYRMMDPGASMGLGYGPILVARADPAGRAREPGRREPGQAHNLRAAPEALRGRPAIDRGRVRQDSPGCARRSGRSGAAHP